MKAIDSWTFDATMPQDKPKEKLNSLIQGACITNVVTIETLAYLSIFRSSGQFVKKWKKMPSEVSWENNMWHAYFLIDNICVKFRDKTSRVEIGIPMGKTCAPQLAELFLYASSAQIGKLKTRAFGWEVDLKLLVYRWSYIVK